jgi:hypothetical protein
VNITPNHLSIHGDTGVSHYFGDMKPPVHTHPGGHPCLRMEFANHLQLEISYATAADIARQIAGALQFPPPMPDVSGATVELEGQP